MAYYFPSILPSLEFSSTLPASTLTVNSGGNAIRLLLRSYGLPENSKVALPLYVCDSLKQAVLKEHLNPLYLDLKPDESFCSDYNVDHLLKERPSAIILVHLYGFLHPDTRVVTEFSKENGICLIHDAAQSYGIEEQSLSYSSGLVYSFGPGKSSTAACGAVVRGLDRQFYDSNCEIARDFPTRRFRARLFLKSRIYGYQFSFVDKLIKMLISRFPEPESICSMTQFQRAAASTAMDLVKIRGEERKERYRLLLATVGATRLLNVAFNDAKGLYFKMVLRVKEDAEHFKAYLRENDVPFFCLADSVTIGKEGFEYPVYSKQAKSLIELSTEASLPLDEIQRVAAVLAKYA